MQIAEKQGTSMASSTPLLDDSSWPNLCIGSSQNKSALHPAKGSSEGIQSIRHRKGQNMFTVYVQLAKRFTQWIERKAGDGIARRIVARLEKKQLYPFSAKCLTGAAVIMLAAVLILLIVIIVELAYFLW